MVSTGQAALLRSPRTVTIPIAGRRLAGPRNDRLRLAALDGDKVMARRTWCFGWMKRSIVLTFVLAAIGYLAGTKTASFSGPLMLTLRRAISAE